VSGLGPLLIVGASGRAAAASARRAGFDPYVIDLFADADTRRLAETVRCPIERYPGAIPELARRLPPGPFLYGGRLPFH
jgi:predicted ATP-grasp superfamily ATP-dependent carboligase